MKRKPRFFYRIGNFVPYTTKALRAGCARCAEEGCFAAAHRRGKVYKPLKIEGTGS